GGLAPTSPPSPKRRGGRTGAGPAPGSQQGGVCLPPQVEWNPVSLLALRHLLRAGTARAPVALFRSNQVRILRLLISPTEARHTRRLNHPANSERNLCIELLEQTATNTGRSPRNNCANGSPKAAPMRKPKFSPKVLPSGNLSPNFLNSFLLHLRPVQRLCLRLLLRPFPPCNRSAAHTSIPLQPTR